MLKVIINAGPCEAYIGKSLSSVKQQTFTDWEAYVSVDPHGDDTFANAIEAKGDDEDRKSTRLNSSHRT